MQAPQKHLRAFTLLELSIALIVIGLVLGGVLIGQEIRQAAVIRSQISDIEQIRMATRLFVERYQYLPGDIGYTAASSVGLHGGNHTGSRNDGKINDFSSTTEQLMYEPVYYWRHLSEANLLPHIEAGVAGTACNQHRPRAMKINSSYGMSTLSDEGYVWLYMGISDCLTGDMNLVTRSSAYTLTPYQASQIDAKTDDGLPLDGRVFSMRFNGSVPAVDDQGGRCMVTPTSNSYHVTNTAPACRLLVEVHPDLR